MKSGPNLRHLEHLVAVCDCNMSVSGAAARLKIAQSAVSRSLIALEQEFGAPLFTRNGRRLVAQTQLCCALVDSARDIAMRMANLHTIAAEGHGQTASDEIRVGATHLQARYIIPEVLTRMHEKFADVRLAIRQGMPADLVELLLTNKIDLAVCTELLGENQALECAQAYSWQRVLVTRRSDPPRWNGRPPSLQDLADTPLVTYIFGITGRRSFDEAFATHGLSPQVAISAADSDVIKTYVRLGRGAGVIADVALEKEADRDLRCGSLSHLFEPMNAKIAHRRDKKPSAAMQCFIKIYCEMSRAHVARLSAMRES